LRLAAPRHQLLVQADEARGPGRDRIEVRGIADRRGADREGEEPRFRHPADRPRLLSAHPRHVAPVVAEGDLQDFPRAPRVVSGDAPARAAAGPAARGEDAGRRAAHGRAVKKPRLIVTADDVGLDAGMTEGAIRAHRDGIVTACSVVANGIDFDEAIACLREVPRLEVGVHLTLVEERSLTTGSPMPRNYV